MASSEVKEPETEMKIGEEDIEPTAPAVATAYAAVACSIYGDAVFEDSSQI